MRFVLDREGEHRQSIEGARHGWRAVARLAGRNPQHFFEREALQRSLRHREMRVMHWIEGAAKNANLQLRTSPWPRTTNFCVVRPSRPTGPRACSLSVEMPISAPRPYS